MHGEAQGAAASAREVPCDACARPFARKKAWQRFCGPKCRNDFHTAEERKERIRQAAPEMYAALRLIAKNSCERLTTGPGSCWSQPTWSREAEFGADRWCDACIALSAIHDLKPAEPVALPKAT